MNAPGGVLEIAPRAILSELDMSDASPLSSNFTQALIQATDTLMTDQTYYTGPVDSWLTAFATWAVSNPDHRFVKYKARSIPLLLFFGGGGTA